MIQRAQQYKLMNHDEITLGQKELKYYQHYSYKTGISATKQTMLSEPLKQNSDNPRLCIIATNRSY